MLYADNLDIFYEMNYTCFVLKKADCFDLIDMEIIFIEPIFCVENYIYIRENGKGIRHEKSPEKAGRRIIKWNIGNP